MRPLVVMIVAGLSERLLSSDDCPRLAEFARSRKVRKLLPPLPALTLPVQATFMTGAPPAQHGVVGNGFYDRAYEEHRFWTASAGLLDRAPFWRTSKCKIGVLFWWHCQGSGADLYLNVAPIHTADGGTVSSCYSDPPGLYPALESDLGPFPLHRFWGPGVSIESSRWILDATLEVAREHAPDVLLTYLPHMDYSLQRSGPGSEEAHQHLMELDDLLGDFLDQVEDGAFDALLLSEYGITPVNGAVEVNRILLEQGLFRVRTVEGRTYPDLPGSRAFAICDHQVAQVYIREPKDHEKVKNLLNTVKGVAEVLEGMDHQRGGDLLILSEPDQWFHYTWWKDEGEAPDYAATVDIHRKIGYDPLELIFDPTRGTIASDPGLIKGSHGLIPLEEENLPLLITPGLESDISKGTEPISAIRIPEVILKLLAARGKEL